MYTSRADQSFRVEVNILYSKIERAHYREKEKQVLNYSNSLFLRVHRIPTLRHCPSGQMAPAVKCGFALLATLCHDFSLRANLWFHFVHNHATKWGISRIFRPFCASISGHFMGKVTFFFIYQCNRLRKDRQQTVNKPIGSISIEALLQHPARTIKSHSRKPSDPFLDSKANGSIGKAE